MWSWQNILTYTSDTLYFDSEITVSMCYFSTEIPPSPTRLSIDEGIFLKDIIFILMKWKGTLKKGSPEIGAFNSPQFTFKWYVFKAITIFLPPPQSGTFPSMDFINVDDGWCSLRESVFSQKKLQ